MWSFIKAFFTDEAAFHRGVIGGMLVGSAVLGSGGVIPGTDYVIDALAGPDLVKIGHGLGGLAVVLATKWPVK